MTGKAALRMRAMLGVSAVTFHAAFFLPPDENDRSASFEVVRPAPPDDVVLVVDEASMMPPSLYDKLREKWMAKGVRVIFCGDAFQLPPVMSKSEAEVYGDDYSIFTTVRGPALTQVMRSEDDVLYAATAVRETGILPRTDRGGYRYQIVKQATPAAAMAFLQQRQDHALITWRNAARVEASRLIRHALGRTSPMPEDGEPILVCRNGQGHLNGEVIDAGPFRPGPQLGPVKTLSMQLHHPVIWYDRHGTEHLRTEITTLPDMTGQAPYLEEREDWQAYVAAKRKQRQPDPLPITWGYALTTHKAQGSEFDEVTLFLSRHDVFSKAFKRMSLLPDRREVTFGTRLLYTAITRAKRRVNVFLGEEG
jgi:exodeoxyribonuclease-5